MLQLLTLAARPDLRPQVFSEPFVAAWPRFMLHDETAELYFAQPNLDACLDTAFAVVESARPKLRWGVRSPCHLHSAVRAESSYLTPGGTQ